MSSRLNTMRAAPILLIIIMAAMRTISLMTLAVLSLALLSLSGCRTVKGNDQGGSSRADGRGSDTDSDSAALGTPVNDNERDTVEGGSTDWLLDTDEGHDDETAADPDEPDNPRDQETAASDDDEPERREGDPCDPQGEGVYCNDRNEVINWDKGWLDEGGDDSFICEPGVTRCDVFEPSFCAGPGSGYENAVLEGVYTCNDEDPGDVHCEWIGEVLVDDCDAPGVRYCDADHDHEWLMEAEARACIEGEWSATCEPISSHVVEDCRANNGKCVESGQEVFCEAVSPCYFLGTGDVCDTGVDTHCETLSDGDYVVHRSGTCEIEEPYDFGFVTLICEPQRERCEEGTTCTLGRDGGGTGTEMKC